MHILGKTILFIFLNGACSAVAHQDRIIKLENGKLIGLPNIYQPAEFSVSELRLRIGNKSLTFPENLGPDFKVKKKNVSFQASWYHSGSRLPHYILVTFKAPKNFFDIITFRQTFEGEYLINLETLELIRCEAIWSRWGNFRIELDDEWIEEWNSNIMDINQSNQSPHPTAPSRRDSLKTMGLK